MHVAKSLALVICLSAFGTAGIVACTSHTTTSIVEDGGSDDTTDTADGGKTQTKADSGNSNAGGSLCEKMCAKAEAANCSKQSSCVSDCEKQLDSVPAACKSKADALIECGATKATGFKCSSSGAATASGCDDEGTALLACIQNPGADDDAGTGSCGTLQTGDATCDTCAEKNCCTEMATCSNNADCLAVLDCFSTQKCNDDACYEACEAQHPNGTNDELSMFQCLAQSCQTQCQ